MAIASYRLDHDRCYVDIGKPARFTSALWFIGFIGRPIVMTHQYLSKLLKSCNNAGKHSRVDGSTPCEGSDIYFFRTASRCECDVLENCLKAISLLTQKSGIMKSLTQVMMPHNQIDVVPQVVLKYFERCPWSNASLRVFIIHLIDDSAPFEPPRKP